MKKLLILIVAFCGIISAHADEPTPAQQAANQANAACSAFGKKAEPSSAENAHGSVTVTTTMVMKTVKLLVGTQEEVQVVLLALLVEVQVVVTKDLKMKKKTIKAKRV